MAPSSHQKPRSRARLLLSASDLQIASLYRQVFRSVLPVRQSEPHRPHRRPNVDQRHRPLQLVVPRLVEEVAHADHAYRFSDEVHG
jgi:hypothetical protein